MPRRKTRLQPGESLVEIAGRDKPPTDITPWLARLQNAGIRRLEFFPELEEARDVVWADGRGVQVYVSVDQAAHSAPLAAALEELTDHAQRFDRLRRLRLAASDMRIAEGAAFSLIDAQEKGGSARMVERVIETGLVVTFTRPYLASNDAGLPARYHPKDEADKQLLDRVMNLRDDYHAHAGHTDLRLIVDTTALLGMNGRPLFAESWQRLPTDALRKVADLARRQAECLEGAAGDVESELFPGSDIQEGPGIETPIPGEQDGNSRVE